MSSEPATPRNSITVIGSSNVDMIMRLAALPRPGETVGDGEFLQVFGGKGANQAVAAARAGGAVSFVTGLGADAFGPQVLDAYRADGIDTSRVLIASEGVPTGTALILVDAAGTNCIAVAPGANYALTPEYLDAACEDLLRDSVLLVLQMEIPAATVAHILRRAEGYGTQVLFNYGPARALDEVPVTGAMTGLIVNESEAGALTGTKVATIDDASAVAEALLERGPMFVIVTLGADGAFLADRRDGLRTHLPAFPVTPIDTTAAGDTFCGALAVALVEGRSLPDAARFASAASALSVTRLGAQPSIPHRAEIDAFLRGKD